MEVTLSHYQRDSLENTAHLLCRPATGSSVYDEEPVPPASAFRLMLPKLARWATG